MVTGLMAMGGLLMYTIRIKQFSTGEISFDTLEEAKEWHEKRDGDVYWYHNDESMQV